METDNTQTNNSNNQPANQNAQQAPGNPLQGLEPNVAAALSYLVPPFTGVLFYLTEKQNKFVRFHAFQSILFGFASWAAIAVANALIALLIGLVLAPIVSILSVLLWLVLIWKSYNNEEYMLPYLGKIAKDQVEK